MKGSDALEELKQMNDSKTKPVGSPEAERRQLLADAAAGLVVAGRTASWLENRPKLLPLGEATKKRGFLAYDRYTGCSKGGKKRQNEVYAMTQWSQEGLQMFESNAG